jgi:hypothetical protein
VTSLWDELHPLAEQVEAARSHVVDAAREHMCGDIDNGGLKKAIGDLDKVQMLLGLKTAQLLLSRQGAGPPSVAGQEEFMREEPEPQVELRGTKQPQPGHVGPWGRKREV